MLSLLLKGAENRHTGETRLNHESSRSHSVFVCTVEKTVTSNGISKCFYAKLNLVDLAGACVRRSVPSACCQHVVRGEGFGRWGQPSQT